jgi:hypothetical protein
MEMRVLGDYAVNRGWTVALRVKKLGLVLCSENNAHN